MGRRRYFSSDGRDYPSRTVQAAAIAEIPGVVDGHTRVPVLGLSFATG
ncbi:hypothetical protein [Kribbella qitaiheensis]|nr:hypothetical protein [Kribbella qitaiheensis]